jgi:hypothetical protein
MNIQCPNTHSFTLEKLQKALWANTFRAGIRLEP